MLVNLKCVYVAIIEEMALSEVGSIEEKKDRKYLKITNNWKDNKVNSTYRKLKLQRSVFPSDTALLKAI